MQQTRVDVFEEIFLVFLGLGTLVGIVVVAYTLYNAYKYRDDGGTGDDENLPSVGELPTGGKGGKKLFLSFGISAIIVISLVIWTYGMLLYVEDPGENPEEEGLGVEVEGDGFAWYYEYDNGVQEVGTLRVPADERIWLQVTSGDVWHTFGIPDQRVKADAIPGEYDETWFMADEPGQTHEIKCFELCGEFHTSMTGQLQVMDPEEFDAWMQEQLTMTISVENANEEPMTEGYELTFEQQNGSFSETYSAEEFDNGTIEIQLEEGGMYNVTITPDDENLEPIEEEIDFDGGNSETYTLEDPNAEDGDDGNGTESESSDGNGTESSDENGGNESDTASNETDGGEN